MAGLNWSALAIVLIAIILQVSRDQPFWNDRKLEMPKQRRAPIPSDPLAQAQNGSTSVCNQTASTPMLAPNCGSRATCSSSGSPSMDTFSGQRNRILQTGIFPVIEGQGCLYVQTRVAQCFSRTALCTIGVAVKFGDSTRFIVKINTDVLQVDLLDSQPNIVNIFSGPRKVIAEFPDGFTLVATLATGHIDVSVDGPERYLSGKSGVCFNSLQDLSNSFNLFNVTNYQPTQYPTLSSCGALRFERSCFKTCAAWGDPHIFRFDGTFLDYPHDGTFYLYNTRRLNISVYHFTIPNTRPPTIVNGAVFVSYLRCDGQLSSRSVLLSGSSLTTVGDLTGMTVKAEPKIVEISFPEMEGVELVALLQAPLFGSVYYIDVSLRIGFNQFAIENCGLCGAWLENNSQTCSSITAPPFVTTLLPQSVSTVTQTVSSSNAAAPQIKSLVDFGIASIFNVLVFDSFSAPSSAIEGSLAVGGDIVWLSAYSIGSGLQNVKVGTEVTLLVGGAVQQWTGGLNYYGNILTGRQSPSLTSAVIYKGSCAITVAQLDNLFNFTRAKSELLSLSSKLSSLPSTVKSLSIEYETGIFQLSNNAEIEVIQIADSQFFINNISFIAPLQNVQTGSVIVFNIAGSASGFTDVNLEMLQKYFCIFNFYQATHLKINRVAVRGHVLAPLASVKDATGTVYGNLYVQSFDSSPLSVSLVPPVISIKKMTSPIYLDCPSGGTGTATGAIVNSDPLLLLSSSQTSNNDVKGCLEFGVASAFNLLTFQDFSGGSFVQGRMAVGGSAKFDAQMTVASALTGGTVKQCQEVTLVVGMRIYPWTIGQNYFGNIVTGMSCLQFDATSVLNAGCCAVVNYGFFPFGTARSQLTALSAGLAARQRTYLTAELLTAECALVITLAGRQDFEVISVNNPQLFMDTNTTCQTLTLRLLNHHPQSLLLFNMAGKNTGLIRVKMEALKEARVIFNFFEAFDVSLQSTIVRGTILAPYATINATTGEIYGQVFANSFQSTAHSISLGVNVSCSRGQLFYTLCSSPAPVLASVAPVNTPVTSSSASPVNTVSTVSTVNTVSASLVNCLSPCSCPKVKKFSIDFGILSSFNAFLWDTYSASSDVQGRVAVGADARFANGFSVADQLVMIGQCREATLIVGRTLSWQSGRNYFGNIVVGQMQGSSINQQSVLSPGCCLVERQGYMDFVLGRQTLAQTSRWMSELLSTVKRFDLFTNTLYLSNSSTLEVIHMSDMFRSFDGRFTFMPTFANYSPTAAIIFNINGTSVSIANHDQESAKSFPVYFNLYEAQTADIRGIAVRGSVIAPNAFIVNATGVVYGSVYARSMSGPIQVNLGVDKHSTAENSLGKLFCTAGTGVLPVFNTTNNTNMLNATLNMSTFSTSKQKQTVDPFGNISGGLVSAIYFNTNLFLVAFLFCVFA